MDNFDVEAIPIQLKDSRAITSVVSGKNGKIYIGLTGYEHVLAEYDPATGNIRDCGVIFTHEQKPVSDKIHNGLAVASDGTLWIGEGSGMGFNGEPRECKHHQFPGGAVFSYNTETGELTKHAIPVAYNSIHSMTLSADNRYLCGYTIPDNHFWMYDIQTGNARDFGIISRYCSHNVGLDGNNIAYCGWRSEQGVLITDDTGAAHNLGKGVYLYRCDLEKQDAERSLVRVVYGDEYNIAGNSGIDAWIRTSTGRLFGSTVFGSYIFEVINNGDDIKYIGKPVMWPRVTGMIEDNQGMIWGTAGYPVMHLFSFHPDDPTSMRDYGPVVTEHPMCYFHGIAVTDDSVIYTGETDSGRSILYKLTPKS